MSFISNKRVISLIKRPEKLHGSMSSFIHTPVATSRTKPKYIPGEPFRVSEEFYIKLSSTQEKMGPVQNSLNLLNSLEICR